MRRCAFPNEPVAPEGTPPPAGYLVVLPPSRVSPEEGLNRDGGGSLPLEASPGCPHARVLLDDHRRSASPQKRNVADDKKKPSKTFPDIKGLPKPAAGDCPPRPPPRPATPCTSLDGDGRSPHPLVLDEGQPSPDGLLDADAGPAQSVGAEPLQERHLPGPEEDLRSAKLKLTRILGTKTTITPDDTDC